MSLQPLHESKMRFCGVQKLLGGLRFLLLLPLHMMRIPRAIWHWMRNLTRVSHHPRGPLAVLLRYLGWRCPQHPPTLESDGGRWFNVLCSHRRVWLISSLVSCSSLLLLFGSPKSLELWSFTTLSKCVHGSAPYKHVIFDCLVFLQLQWCLKCFAEVFQ